MNKSSSPLDISINKGGSGAENNPNNPSMKKGSPFEKVYVSSWGFAKYGQLCSPVNGSKISGPILIE